MKEKKKSPVKNELAGNRFPLCVEHTVPNAHYRLKKFILYSI